MVYHIYTETYGFILAHMMTILYQIIIKTIYYSLNLIHIIYNEKITYTITDKINHTIQTEKKAQKIKYKKLKKYMKKNNRNISP